LSDQKAAVDNLAHATSAILDAIEPLAHIRLGVVGSCRPSG
jgi:hypothetical protein